MSKYSYGTSLNGQPISGYTPPPSVQSNAVPTPKTSSITGAWKGYDIQTVSLQPGDVLLVHVSDNLDLDECQHILKIINETFPDNKCVLCNEHILKGLTIIKPEKISKIDNVVNISTNVDVDKLFEKIMRGNSNDFLY